MPSRAIGAFLALAAAAAIVVSIAASAWWAGAPVVEGKQIETKYVHAGPLGATGCNVGGDGSCTPITVDDTVQLVGYAALGTAALATLFLFILMSAALRVGERRKGIATTSLLFTLLAAAGAGALLVLGPGIKASQQVNVPIGWGTFAFGGGIVAALLASLITRRLEPEPLRLKPGVAPAPSAKASRQQRPLRASQQHMQPSTPDPRPAAPAPQLRPLYEVPGAGYAPPTHAPQVPTRSPSPDPRDALGQLLDSMGPSTPALSPQLGGGVGAHRSNAYDDESDLEVPGGLVDEAVNPFARTKAPTEVPPHGSSPRIRPPQDNAASSSRIRPQDSASSSSRNRAQDSASPPARASAANIADLVAPASLVGGSNAARDPAGIAGDPLRSKPPTASPMREPTGIAGDPLRSRPPTAGPNPPGMGPSDSGRMRPPTAGPNPPGMGPSDSGRMKPPTAGHLPGMGPSESGRMKPPTAPPSPNLPGMGPNESGRMKPPTAPPGTSLPGMGPSDSGRMKPPTAGPKLPGLPPAESGDAARSKSPSMPPPAPGDAARSKSPSMPPPAPGDAARSKSPSMPPPAPTNAARAKAASIPPPDAARAKAPSVPPPIGAKVPSIAPSIGAKVPSIAPPIGAKLPSTPPASAKGTNTASSDAAGAKAAGTPPADAGDAKAASTKLAGGNAKAPTMAPADARVKAPSSPGDARSKSPSTPGDARSKSPSSPLADGRMKPPSIPPVRPVVPAPGPRGKAIVVPEHLRASTDIGTPPPAQPSDRQSRPGIPNLIQPPAQSKTIAHAVPPMPSIDSDARRALDENASGDEPDSALDEAMRATDFVTAVEIDHEAKAAAAAAKHAASAARDAANDDDDGDAYDADGQDAGDDTDDVDASNGGSRRAATDMRTGKNPLASPAVGERTAVGLLAAPPAPALRFGAGRADSQDEDEGTVQTPIPTREPGVAAGPIDLMKTIEMNGRTPIPTLGRTGSTAAEAAAQRYAFDTDQRADAADRRADAADKRPVQVPISTAPSTLPPPKQLDPVPSGPTPACPQCESPMSWVDEHLRFYCRSCRMYF